MKEEDDNKTDDVSKEETKAEDDGSEGEEKNGANEGQEGTQGTEVAKLTRQWGSHLCSFCKMVLFETSDVDFEIVCRLSGS